MRNFDEFWKNNVHIKAMNEKELMVLYRQLERTTKQVGKQYHEVMMRDVFSVSKRTLKELVGRNDWADVEKTMTELFSIKEESMGNYERVFSELKHLKPASDAEQFVVALRFSEDDGEDEEAGYYDVVAHKKGSVEHYALDFTPWEEWLSYYCDEKSLKEQGDVAFISHCLYEMTFDGFDRETIHQRLKELVERIPENEENR